VYEVKAKNSFFFCLFYMRVSRNCNKGLVWWERGEGGAVPTAGAGVGGKINILNKKIFSTFTAQVLR
jgi:hypothetical protein